MSSGKTPPPNSDSDFALLKDDFVEGADEYSQTKSKSGPLLSRLTSSMGGGGEAKSTGIAKATGLMMAAVLLSRVLGVLRDAIISHYFGRGAQTDAYNAAFTVPDLLWNLLQSGALASTIVPIITEYRAQGKNKTADKVVGIVATSIVLFIGLAVVLMEIFTPQLTRFLNPGFDANRIAMSVPLTRVLLPAQMCFFLGGLLTGVQYSRKQFLIPAFGPVIYNGGIICGALIMGPFFPPDVAIKGLVWGALGGAIVGNLLLPWLGVYQLGVRIRPSFEFLHPSAIKVWRMLLPIGLGVGLPSIDQPVNKFFASYFGTGDTTALMNAYRLMLLPIGVFAQSMAIAVFPTLSAQAAEKDFKSMRSTLNQSLRNILFLTLPASALIFVLANPIITFLLQSGQYKAYDTAVTAAVLQFLAVGIFAWSCSSLLTRGFYALQASKVPAISGAIVSVIFILMNATIVHSYLGIRWGSIFVPANTATQATVSNVDIPVAPTSLTARPHNTQVSLSWTASPGATSYNVYRGTTSGGESATPVATGLTDSTYVDTGLTDGSTYCYKVTAVNSSGTSLQSNEAVSTGALGIRWLALATSVSAAIHCFALLFLLARRLQGIQRSRLITSAGKTLLATIALAIVATMVNHVVDDFSSHVAAMHPKIRAAIALILAGGGGIAAFYWVARLLKMSELEAGVNMVTSKLVGVKKLLRRG